MTEADYSEIVIKPATRCSYETGNIGAWKIWHVFTRSSTKEGVNKGGGYSIAYAPQKDCNKAAEI